MELSCIGVGAGPSNLSLACQIHEQIGRGALFLDRQLDFRWHPGSALDSPELQVNHLKDLVTLVNPRSAYTFVNYLYENGRLFHFLNAQFEAVLRAEFEQYLNWAFHRNPLVCGGETVREIRFEGEFRVWTDDAVRGARDLVIGTGKQPRIPSQFRGWTGRNLFHLSDLPRIHPEVWKKDVCVVGGGQLGAEVLLHLVGLPKERRPRSITWVSECENYQPIDNSPFTNELFIACSSDRLAAMSESQRKLYLRRFVLASDCISEGTLRAIYQAQYRHAFLEPSHCEITLRPGYTVSYCVNAGAGHRLSLRRGRSEVEEVTADIVILATGYENALPDFLEPMAGRLEKSDNELAIREDFSVCWDGPPERRIFVQNATLGQRGLADPNLGLLAWRARRILDSLLGRVPQANREQAGFIRPAPVDNWPHLVAEEMGSGI
ncbi:lysine/ornithine N-monooxygenase [Mesorhizobium australicum WSM2073]|uniref:Lysine/ornithine N-monooxygenase n=3 Tax=Mesorhizobium TaxID=68287 RepID=L0KTR3_MESAW|nr:MULTISPECIES: SidA/IucD/PvdA family monooxygenase [Mesorhizobium]ADV14832.1 L-lysine 6-monooxygenase (NADPH) [Mesorhizobium ciceri biovar biserrulae WSM1271]AEH90722.1 L-lysine 6-monooxygenase (NADPH) [Mesorhizobium opportunistum WSM2075]AGB48090.1 lysine/ornithine N-monooxygenase [Mesorhizobium australicum WSM2073]OBP84792.1 lysine N6-hydroxylase [Mesorhizobium loti]